MTMNISNKYKTKYSTIRSSWQVYNNLKELIMN